MKRTLTLLLASLTCCAMILAFSGAGLAETPDEIRIGLMFGLTGPASPIGPVQMNGAKMAIEEINAAGGVNLDGKKIPVVAVVKDDETKGDVAAAPLQRVAE